jgi:hypothetical protein
MVCRYKDRGTVSTGAAPAAAVCSPQCQWRKGCRDRARGRAEHISHVRHTSPTFLPPYCKSMVVVSNRLVSITTTFDDFFPLSRKIQARAFASIQVETMKTVTSAKGCIQQLFPGTNIEWEVPQHPRCKSRGRENGMYRPTLAQEAPSSIHMFATTLPVNTDTLPIDDANYRQSLAFLG